MFRASFVIVALASALALNGCSQCSKQESAEAPAVVLVPVEATPVDAAAVPVAPADPAVAAPGAEGVAPVPEATPAPAQ
jgi:PBP1b-binding outer membrane lipoprotein LpoB